MDGPHRKRIKIGDREVDATPVRVRQSNEVWNDYLLDDGSVLRVKLVLTETLVVEGEYDPDGNPLYVFRSSNVMVVSSPDALRKKL